jgi:hypothetical protein
LTMLLEIAQLNSVKLVAEYKSYYIRLNLERDESEIFLFSLQAERKSSEEKSINVFSLDKFL